MNRASAEWREAVLERERESTPRNARSRCRSGPSGLCPVRLAELVDVGAGGSPRARWKALSQVVGKSVDFVICDRWSLDPVMLLEVDDRSHRAPARRERDALVDSLCAEVGLPLVRVKARFAYSEDALLRALQASGFWLAPKFTVS